MFKIALLLLTLGCVVALSAQPQSQDWNQWRGGGRDAVASRFTVPDTWPDRPRQRWRIQAGIGHSSPVIAGNRVFLFSRVGERESMTAYDLATGKVVWTQGYEAPYKMNPAATGHGKGPKGTPVVQGGQVFALGISGVLSAFDAGSGTVLWRKDFGKEFAATSPDFGASMSPLVDGGQVIAHVGGAGAGAIIAFDRADGAQRWAWKGDGPGYASPVLATFGGTVHLITQTQSHLVGLSPADGRELWRTSFTTDYDQNVITPVVADGLLIYGGLSKPTVAARVVQEKGTWKLTEVWRNADVPMYMSSPVAAAGVLYGLTHRNRGQFFALDLATGKTLWTGPPRQSENAAIVAASGLIIAATTDGELIVMRQGRTAFVLVRKYTLADSPVWAHPAFTRDGILIKDAETLTYWGF